jgi:hypothetical protein
MKIVPVQICYVVIEELPARQTHAATVDSALRVEKRITRILPCFHGQQCNRPNQAVGRVRVNAVVT